MSGNEIIKQAINLKPQEKYLIIESLVQSLNEPDNIMPLKIKTTI